MTDKGKEKISAFLDNDMHQDELMSFSLSSEPEDAKLAQRYQMIGDAMRGELSESSFVDVSDAVREALANEAIELAEQPSQTQTKTKQPVSDVSSTWDLAAWFKPVTGMAVAASVAVVMVVTMSTQETGGLSPVAENVKQQPAVMTADVKTGGVKPTTENVKAMKPYVNQHLEYATQDTLQGRLPFVRAVSYEAEK